MSGQAAAPLRPMLDDATIDLAIRLLLGRPPRDAAEVEGLRGHRSPATLRLAVMRLEEGRAARAPAPAAAAPSPTTYTLPLALLRPPEDPAVPWRFRQPDLRDPVSQLCTAAQFAEPDYERWCAALREPPVEHRKQWEFVWLLAALEKAGMLRPGARGLGFGTGREKLPSLFAGRGMTVVATDAPGEAVAEAGWSETNQHAASLADLFHRDVVNEADFTRNASFRPVDMNAIPDDLRDFDFCWSSCSLEHIGSIAQGLAFVRNSLATLRPGGIALHTTEFNLSSDEATLESPGLSLFRRQDLLRLAGELVAEGHEVWPINLHPGHERLDAHIDLPPHALPHMKLMAAEWVVTSVGIAVRRSTLSRL
jgi:2-polyprenyl-3-methyl-5-hydroxy-6-metoxy-1,4-benzoquinol methylase